MGSVCAKSKLNRMNRNKGIQIGGNGNPSKTNKQADNMRRLQAAEQR